MGRKEVLKRPGLKDEDDDSDADKGDYDIEEDYDAIDDQLWTIILECCVYEPQDRPDIARVRELMGALKIQDDRPVPKEAPGAEILKSRADPKTDLNRMEDLFDEIQVYRTVFLCRFD